MDWFLSSSRWLNKWHERWSFYISCKLQKNASLSLLTSFFAVTKDLWIFSWCLSVSLFRFSWDMFQDFSSHNIANKIENCLFLMFEIRCLCIIASLKRDNSCLVIQGIFTILSKTTFLRLLKVILFCLLMADDS